MSAIELHTTVSDELAVIDYIMRPLYPLLGSRRWTTDRPDVFLQFLTMPWPAPEDRLVTIDETCVELRGRRPNGQLILWRVNQREDSEECVQIRLPEESSLHLIAKLVNARHGQ